MRDLYDIANSENDIDTCNQLFKEALLIQKNIFNLEIESIFSGEADPNDAFLEIHAGAGGNDSNDWAEMLKRMYIRWAENNGFLVEEVDEVRGEEAGIKSSTIKIKGSNAYGWLKVESGVHRLVRISPFNSNGKRQTSFASIWVYPVVDDSISIEINDKDLRVDTFRASGAGGQHVNKTDSAIRITHIPTNIVVQSQSSRSQHRNRDEAMSMLKSRLYELELTKRREQEEKNEASKTDNSWGHQIRSYVLHPYQMVKDLRSGFETGNINSVLDGNLQEFMSSVLLNKK